MARSAAFRIRDCGISPRTVNPAASPPGDGVWALERQTTSVTGRQILRSREMYFINVLVSVNTHHYITKIGADLGSSQYALAGHSGVVAAQTLKFATEIRPAEYIQQVLHAG